MTSPCPATRTGQPSVERLPLAARTKRTLLLIPLVITACASRPTNTATPSPVAPLTAPTAVTAPVTDRTSTTPATSSVPVSSIDAAPPGDTAPPTASADITASTTASTVPPSTTVDVPATDVPASTTPPVPAVLTTLDPFAGTFNAACVRAASGGDTLQQLSMLTGPSLIDVWAENGYVDTLTAGQLVDVCAGNGVNDISGAPSTESPAAIRAALTLNVRRQQQRVNELLAPYATDPIDVDGRSGPRTGQHLCAIRVALGLPATVDDMHPGSDEQAAMFAVAALPAPASTLVDSERWALIDRTCQMMFIGTGSELIFVFPTSTGSPGYETRDQDRARVFRFDPAVDNGGWHDSAEFPAGVDNPLNGNMFKPLYFDVGQAIHGANSVPPTPQSHGCARLSVPHQTALISWLGLDALTAETWVKRTINLTVNVQGQFVGRPS